ncbi:MAG TPA: 16S rRNA (guanine(527)-N(7))-methyltransferase RsmG [Acidobacteriota bacterium]|nr:16S rRNA (guanine(527)-N(7))-methyltransferase RsmG [Acidobacteriota bacterium]
MTNRDEGVLVRLERAFGLTLTAEQRHQVRIYVEELRRWNRRINLTAIDRVDEHLRLNFFEAFWAAREFVGTDVRLADVGAGAGFPGLAMKIYRPELPVTLLEPNYKKAIFLKEMARQLELGVSVLAVRGEEFDDWNEVNLACFRALRPSAELLDRLASRGVDLLLFEGRQGVRNSRFRLVREAKVPLSEHRQIRLLTAV